MGAVSAIWAPQHRALARSSNLANAGIPLNAAPSLDFLASGLQDHRMQYNARGSSATLPGIVGWWGAADPCVINYVPATIATANIAALANVTSGTAMTLVSSTGAGITVLSTSAPATFYPQGNVVSAGCAIDGLPGLQLFGTAGNFTTGFYDPASCVGRAVSITGSTSGTGGHFIVSGYDVYGYPQTENINATSGATTTNGKKAFKVVTSVVPQFTDAHQYSVGTTDIYGFGLRADVWGQVSVNWNSAWITANTGFTAADTSTPSSTTGDVRGTYATQDASNGTKRLVVYVSPGVAALASNPTTGLFGKTPA